MATPTQADLEEMTAPKNRPNSGRITHRVRLERILAEMAARVSSDMVKGSKIPTRTHPRLDRGLIAHYGRVHAPNVQDWGVGVMVQEMADEFLSEDDGEFDVPELDELQSELEALSPEASIAVSATESPGSGGATLHAFAPAPTTFVLPKMVPVINSPALAAGSAVNPGVALGVGVLAVAAIALQVETSSPRIPSTTRTRRRRKRCERCVSVCASIIERITEDNLERIVDDRCLVTTDTAKRTRVKAYSRKI